MPNDGTDTDEDPASWLAPDAGELEGSYEITVVDPSSVPALELAWSYGLQILVDLTVKQFMLCEH